MQRRRGRHSLVQDRPRHGPGCEHDREHDRCPRDRRQHHHGSGRAGEGQSVTTQSASLGGASGGDYTARKLFEDTKPLAEGLEPITGLGDDAFFGAVAGMQVSVLRGDVYLSVTAPFGTTDADATTVRALAPLAVGRLP